MEGEDRLVVARFEERREECDWGCERHRCDGAGLYLHRDGGYRIQDMWEDCIAPHTHTRLYPHKCTKLVKSE